MFMKKTASILFIFSTFISSCYAGFGLETTRVIYHEKDNSEGVVAFNTDKNRNYLLQSWIEDEKGKITQNFAVTPPLLKLRAEQKNTIQLTKIAELPNDRESLYWLNVKFVAPSSEDLENVLRYSMTNRIKLIYRPTALTDDKLENSIKEVKWIQSESSLKVSNPTPFYINIAKLKVNAKEIDAPSYIEPFSDFNISLPKNNGKISNISLTYINDYGRGLEVEYPIK